MLHKNCNASNNQNELCDMFELTKRFMIDAKFKYFIFVAYRRCLKIGMP